jgi:hypothetical protein
VETLEAERRILEGESLSHAAAPVAQPSEGSSDPEATEGSDYRSQLRDLESQLLQSEARARSAYAATEAAEAALRMTKEAGFLPSMHPSGEEFQELLTRLDEMTGRADQAERSLKRAEADIAALRAGVDPDALVDPLPAVEPVGNSPEPAADPAPSTSPADAAPSGPEIAPSRPAATPQDSDSWVAGPQPSKLSLRRLAGAASGKKHRDGDPSGR